MRAFFWEAKAVALFVLLLQAGTTACLCLFVVAGSAVRLPLRAPPVAATSLWLPAVRAPESLWKNPDCSVLPTEASDVGQVAGTWAGDDGKTTAQRKSAWICRRSRRAKSIRYPEGARLGASGGRRTQRQLSGEKIPVGTCTSRRCCAWFPAAAARCGGRLSALWPPKLAQASSTAGSRQRAVASPSASDAR